MCLGPEFGGLGDGRGAGVVADLRGVGIGDGELRAGGDPRLPQDRDRFAFARVSPTSDSSCSSRSRA